MIKRLTNRNKYGRWVVDFHGLDGRVIKELHGVEIDRLAAYEDTGLSPEEIKAQQQEIKLLNMEITELREQNQALKA